MNERKFAAGNSLSLSHSNKSNATERKVTPEPTTCTYHYSASLRGLNGTNCLCVIFDGFIKSSLFILCISKILESLCFDHRHDTSYLILIWLICFVFVFFVG